MKKICSVLLAAVLILSVFPAVPVLAASGMAGPGCTWELQGTTLTISGTGEMYQDRFDSSLPWGTTVKSVTVANGVTSVGAYAFQNCAGLTSVSLPDTVTKIGSHAFSGCSSLNSIRVPAGVNEIGAHAFDGCIGLTTFQLPQQLTEISDSLFSSCTALREIVLPANVTLIGNSAFSGCFSLQHITMNQQLLRISNYAFFGCTELKHVVIPDGVTSIGFSAFGGCTGLTELTVPFVGAVKGEDTNTHLGYIFGDAYGYLGKASVPVSLKRVTVTNTTAIGERAFSGCSGLESVVLCNYVEHIGAFAFSGCTELIGLELPTGLISIGESAFSDCIGLKTMAFPPTLKSVGKNAFSGCSGLKTVSAASLTAWCGITFDGISANPLSVADSLLINGVRVTDVTFPDSVTVVPAYAFSGYKALRSVTVPSATTTIGAYAFAGCIGLVTLLSDRCLTQVGANAFSGSALQDVYYNGTWEEKNAIVIQANNSELLLADWHFTLCDVQGHTYAHLTDTVCIICHTTRRPAPGSVMLNGFTDTVVTVAPGMGLEYSIDGIHWTSNPVFTGLSPATEYTIYARYAATAQGEASAAIGQKIVTDKTKPTFVPSAPTLESRTADSVILTRIEGCEYSIDGIHWQSSPVFSGLSAGTEYVFYQRLAETTVSYAGKSSVSVSFFTDKATRTAPGKPTPISITYQSVTLLAVSGYEYSKDGVYWQTSNVFDGLIPDTNYFFYQRIAETDIYYATAAGEPLIIHTPERPAYLLGDLDEDGYVTDSDALYLLFYTFFPEEYPANQPCDFDGNGVESDQDAIYLLFYTFFPNDYPLHG